MLAAMRPSVLQFVLAAPVLFALPQPVLAQVTWWDKEFDGALAAASESKAKMVLLYFWHDPDGNCSAMFGGTLSDAKVTPMMADFVCMGAKDNDEAGKALFKRFGVERVPTILFLAPDATVVDVVTDYVPVAEFTAAIARIEKGEKTVAALRDAAAKAPDDFALQLEYVRKLRATGDKKGSLAVIEAITQKDPQGKNEFAAEAMMLKIIDDIFKPEITPQDVELEPLRAFLAKQKNKRILFLGYDRMAAAEYHRDNLKAAAALAEKAWKNIPPDQVLTWGQNIAAKAYEDWKAYDKIDKGILKTALTISEKALDEVKKDQKAHPDNAFLANAMYLHAAVLNINNKRKEAFALMDQAIATDPKNENLKKAKEQWMDGSK